MRATLRLSRTSRVPCGQAEHEYQTVHAKDYGGKDRSVEACRAVLDRYDFAQIKSSTSH